MFAFMSDTSEPNQAISRAGAYSLKPAHAVRSYLKIIAAIDPSNRRLHPNRLRDDLASLDQRIDESRNDDSVSPLEIVKMLQRRREIRALLEAHESLAAVEIEFVKYAAEWGGANGIDYETWREFGVDADVLARASIVR